MDTTELSKSEVLENWTFIINKAFTSSVKNLSNQTLIML